MLKKPKNRLLRIQMEISLQYYCKQWSSNFLNTCQAVKVKIIQMPKQYSNIDKSTF